MNGLKLIRKQCNYSMAEVAEVLGISRQVVSAWERGQKTIPEKRKKQLEDYFGISARYFGEISEEDKTEILDTPMFRYACEGKEAVYRYLPPTKEGTLVFRFVAERKYTVDETVEMCKQENKALLRRVEDTMARPNNGTTNDYLAAGYRSRKVFGRVADVYEHCFTRPIPEKMIYWSMCELVTDALANALGRTTYDENVAVKEEEDLHFQQDIQEKISQYLEKKVKGIYDRKPMPNRIVKEKLVLSFEERKKRAQEKYASLKAQGIDTTEIDIWG